MRICDTGGIEEEAGLHNSYFHGAKGLVLVLRPESEEDEEIDEYIELLQNTVQYIQSRQQDVAISIVLNAVDEEKVEAILEKVPEEWRDFHAAVDASDPESVKEMFTGLFDRIGGGDFCPREEEDE